MSRLALIAAVAALLLVCTVATVSAERTTRYDGHQVLRIDTDRLTPAQSYALKHLHTKTRTFHIDFWADNDIRVSPKHYEAVTQYLKNNALKFSVMIPDLQAAIEKEDAHRAQHRSRCGNDVMAYPQGADDFFADYHSLEDINVFNQNLATTYPDLVTQSVIGTSYGGFPIHAYVVTSQKNTGSKQAIYLECGIHAREWIAHATCTYMLNALVTGYGNDTHITSLLDQLEYHIVPVVNVDGYLYTWSTDRMWRKTTKPNAGSTCIGTDPNRNWNNSWCLDGGSTDPCDESYCGSAPFSEACVLTVANYVAQHDNIVAAIDFHSYSQLWMLPYGYTAALPANNQEQLDMANQAVNALTAQYNTSYQIGNIYTVIYPASGSSADFFYDNTTHVKYSYGVELRDQGQNGFLLPPVQIIPSGIETLQAVLAMGDYLVKQSHDAAVPKQLFFGKNMGLISRRPKVHSAKPVTKAHKLTKKITKKHHQKKH